MVASRGWVVDASVAAKWYLHDEEHVEAALTLLEDFEAGLLALTAPYIIRYEIAATLVRAARTGRITAEQLRHQLERFLQLAIHETSDPDVRLETALGLCFTYRIALYDALYVALAQELGFRFVTADAELYRRVRDDLPHVAWIGDLPVS
jgi:predicted nucleic acid-binding protein